MTSFWLILMLLLVRRSESTMLKCLWCRARPLARKNSQGNRVCQVECQVACQVACLSWPSSKEKEDKNSSRLSCSQQEVDQEEESQTGAILTSFSQHPQILFSCVE